MTINELHTKAMELATDAFFQKSQGNTAAFGLFNEAYFLEREAALIAYNSKLGEPTTSILLRSAASIALNAGKIEDSEKLTCLGLSGEPPYEIAEELRNLLEDIHFQRHLKLQGTTINPSELQMVIAGKGVGYGMAKSDEILSRIDVFEKIAFRTVERKTGKAFRKKGAIAKEIKLGFQPYLSTPRAASFAFTLQLGINGNNHNLFGENPTVDIIDDIFDNIGLVNDGDYESLKKKIPDEGYFNNFIGLSKELAPDGNDISLVGLTVVRNGVPRELKFTKHRSDINLTAKFSNNLLEAEEAENGNQITLTGRLTAADDDSGDIRLNIKNGGKEKIKVPDGLEDIVRKYFSENVVINAYRVSKSTVILSSIDPAD